MYQSVELVVDGSENKICSSSISVQLSREKGKSGIDPCNNVPVSY